MKLSKELQAIELPTYTGDSEQMTDTDIAAGIALFAPIAIKWLNRLKFLTSDKADRVIDFLIVLIQAAANRHR